MRLGQLNKTERQEFKKKKKKKKKRKEKKEAHRVSHPKLLKRLCFVYFRSKYKTHHLSFPIFHFNPISLGFVILVL